jgi:excisionase family DNA binding protein
MRTPQQEQAAFQWLTVNEVASDPRLRVSGSIIRRMIEAGELAAIDISSPGSKRPTYRVNPASVDDLVKRRTVKQAA